MGSIRGKAHRLPNTHVATVSTPVGRWMKVQGRFKMQTHPTSTIVVIDIAALKVSHSVGSDMDATALSRARSTSIGAMENMSGKVQNESTHLLRRNHEHAHSIRSIQGPVQGGTG